MDGFDQQAICQQIEIGRKAVELLRKAVVGNDGTGAGHLGFAEDEGQNWDAEIAFGNAEEAPSVLADVALHGVEDLRRVKLLALGVQRKSRIKHRSEDLRGHTELLEEHLPQPLEQAGIWIAYRKQVQLLHGKMLAKPINGG